MNAPNSIKIAIKEGDYEIVFHVDSKTGKQYVCAIVRKRLVESADQLKWGQGRFREISYDIDPEGRLGKKILKELAGLKPAYSWVLESQVAA